MADLGEKGSLKANLEDGYTKLANLILEALAMCKISGTQHGICLFLLRRTYGWDKKEDAISLPDFAAACGTSQPYISRQLKDLLEKKIIIRVAYQPGKTPVYTFNTRVTEWDKGCINVQGLSDCVRQGLYKCARVGLSDCVRVNQEQSLEPPEIEADLKKELKKDKEIITTTNPAVPFKKITDLYHELCPSLPKIVKMPESRKTHVTARWNQYDQDIEVFINLFTKAEKSDFLTRRAISSNPKYKDFIAKFDWLINEANMAKVLEGNYDNRAGPGPPPGSHTQKGGGTSGKHSNLYV